MSKYKTNFKGYQGYSYGLEYPVQFVYAGAEDGWVVYNVKTGKVYAKNLKEWDAPGRCVQENEKLGFGCKPDIAAIDSTP